MQVSRAFVGAILTVIAALALAGCEDESAQQPELQLQSGPAVVTPSQKANLSLAIEPVGYLFTEGRHRFTQRRRFTESNGVGVTLNKGQVCVARGSECVEATVAYRINANDELIQVNHYVATKQLPDRATLHYWGIDDNGQRIEIHYELDLELPSQAVQ